MLRTTVAFAGVVLLGASCATCTTDKVVADDEELAVESPVVTFPQTFVGTRSSKTVMLVNRAGGPREATLSVAPPFSVDRRAARLEGGASLTVTVSFEPLEALRYQGGLGVVTGSKELQVELHGEGAELPRCVSENRCVSSGFDPDLLRCSETTLADGTPCSEGCLENASCSRGQCVGTARSCDDMNGCTVDSCSAGGSCVHGQVVDACKKEDPCTSPVCDVDAGIVRVPTADGTPCGPDKPIRVTGTSGEVERFRCESALTRGPGSYGGIVAILDDHLLAIRLVASASASPVMSLHLLHLPGVRPARVGWHGPQGRSEGDFRPR